MNNEERNTGKTTGQMLLAPRNAVFVWCAHDLSYPRRLAESIGRDDLEIIGPSQMHYKLRGRRPTGIVVDHATKLDICQRDMLATVMAHMPPNA